MTLAPFYAAPLVVKIHLLSAIGVAALTPFQFWGFRKGSTPHRLNGYAWLVAMLGVAISSFWITSRSPVSFHGFSPIHLLSLLALYSVGKIVLSARAGRLAVHRKAVIGLSIGFWVAGAFTLVPTRLMSQIVFG